jgi:anti-anti-sigma regulatory factor
VLRAVIAGHRHVHVDLSGVTQIRAGLVGALLRVQRGLRRVDGSLTVIAPLPPAADMVRAARLDLLMDVTTSVGAAPQPATTWPGHGR